MSTININGRTFFGKSITIRNGIITIDGKESVDGNTLPEKEINISIVGDVEKLDVDYCKDVKVDGNVNKVNTASGAVNVQGNVAGGIDTASGSVTVSGNVDGDIDTASGSVSCRDVSGDVSTMSGSIRHS